MGGKFSKNLDKKLHLRYKKFRELPQLNKHRILVLKLQKASNLKEDNQNKRVIGKSDMEIDGISGLRLPKVGNDERSLNMIKIKNRTSGTNSPISNDPYRVLKYEKVYGKLTNNRTYVVANPQQNFQMYSTLFVNK